MKSFIIGFIGVIFIIASCTPPVVFDQAYPIGAEDLEKIPDNYQGTFICESDSSLLLIQDHVMMIRKEGYFELELKYIEEREDCNMDGDEMYVSGREECIPVEIINNSLVRGFVVDYDTLFIMADKSVARMYEGHLVLSTELFDHQWAVSFLSLEPNTDIIYRAITDKTQVQNVGKVTAMEDITTKDDKNSRYKIRPTMKQFDELFYDEKVFIECEYMTRVFLNEGPSKTIKFDGIN